jgi:hypothetical protein
MQLFLFNKMINESLVEMSKFNTSLKFEEIFFSHLLSIMEK